MLDWLFKKPSRLADNPVSFQYGDSLALDWNENSEGWTCALTELGDKAQIYIGPRVGVESPQLESCALVVQVREHIVPLNNLALEYLVNECSSFVHDIYKQGLSVTSFRPKGIEIFEHEGTPGEYSLTYNPIFDSGAIWRVHFKQHLPTGWGFDD